MNRAADVAIAGVGLALTSPVIGLAALATKLEDRGPVRDRQTRVGKDGVDFEVLKLRTMVVGAERMGAGSHAFGPDDHRAELEHLEVHAVLADPGLPVPHRPAILELRRERREADDRARQGETDSGDRHVGRAVHRVPLALSHVCGVPVRR